MGLEQVVDEVLARGRAEADEIRKTVQAERERILQDARAEAAKLIAAREAEAKKAAERARVQDLARAELESKKIVLAGQKELLDEVYARVLQKLAGLAEAADLLRSLLQANASEWRAGKVYCNARDAEVVRSVVGPNFGGTIDCVGGFVIEIADGTRKTDLRFETLLADVWRDSIREVAEVLWPTS
jgi:V/A-type H+-transporting ATPase subunit E